MRAEGLASGNLAQVADIALHGAPVQAASCG